MDVDAGRHVLSGYVSGSGQLQGTRDFTNLTEGAVKCNFSVLDNRKLRDGKRET